MCPTPSLTPAPLTHTNTRPMHAQSATQSITEMKDKSKVLSSELDILHNEVRACVMCVHVCVYAIACGM